MSPQLDPIRRHPDGSIDFGFYTRRAATMRAAEQRAAPRRWMRALRRLLKRRARTESILLFPAGKA